MPYPHTYKQLLVSVLVLGAALVSNAAESVPPSHVTINNETNPLGIDREVPVRFGWHMESPRRSELQTAYRVVVASTAKAANAGTGDVWDSGKVMSSEQTGIPYGGRLAPRTGYFMRVKLWDRENRETPWSDVATFETAMLSPQDWKAQWMEGSPNLNYVRREFQIDAKKTIGRARAYVAGVGSYVMRVNGKKVGDEYMAPMKTYYDTDKSRILYRTFDIAGLLKPGANAVGIMLQSGFLYGGSYKAICEIHIDYTDGTQEVVLSDANWKGYTGGPYVLASYIDGETYDARKELTGWDRPGFDDHAWTAPGTPTRPIANGVLNAIGAGEVLCDNDGSTWTDYTLATRFQIKSGFVSLVFRAQDPQNLYMWQLNEGGTLRPHKLVNGTYALFKQVDIGTISAGWHDLKIECTGSTIKTTLDGVLKDTTVDGTYNHGKVGIRQVGADTAEIDTMSVTAADGTVLLNDTFDTDANWSQLYKAQRLVAQTSRTIAHQPLTPKLLNKAGTASRYDLGANISGFVELDATGAAGDMVTITTAERIKPTGELDRSSYIIGNVFSARSIDEYTLKGGGPESYRPEFTSHGFRYFEISAPATTSVTNVVVKVLGNSMPLQAHFDCSTKVLNEIYQGYVWGQRDNSISFPMGCNNRAERHPWVLDAQVTEQAAMLYFGAHGFYEKWLNDFLDGEMANGFMAVVVPGERGGIDPIWSAAAATLAWDHFAAYGDTAVAAHYYPRAMRYIACLDAWAPTGIMTSTPEHMSQWTDWLAIDNQHKSDPELFLTLYYYRSVDFVKNLAQALGKTADVTAYEATLAKIRDAFNARFLHTDHYDDGQQAADALSLYFGLVPEASRAAVAKHLAADVKARGTHLTVGALGAYALLGALHDNGQEDVAYELATQTTFPSWGYMVENGPGTYWENWNGEGSLNHPFMAGGVSRYVINAVGGIDRLEPAYKKIQIKPYTGGGQTHASTRLETVRGDIVMNWKKSGGVLTYHTEIPANTTAEIFFPISSGGTNVTTDGQRIFAADGNHKNTDDLTYLRFQGGYAVFKMGSGTYDITINP